MFKNLYQNLNLIYNKEMYKCTKEELQEKLKHNTYQTIFLIVVLIAVVYEITQLHMIHGLSSPYLNTSGIFVMILFIIMVLERKFTQIYIRMLEMENEIRWII